MNEIISDCTLFSKTKLTTVLGLFLLPSMGVGGALFANEMDTLSVRQMDEVVVVSTPKEHNALRLQPLASTSLGQAQLLEKGVKGIKDLSANIPGLFIPTYGSRLTSSIFSVALVAESGRLPWACMSTMCLWPT